jgi:hypothetical protein
MNNPTFIKISDHIRGSTMPEEIRHKLQLLFFRVSEVGQKGILACLESNPNALPIFAEFVTELEQENINTNDALAIQNLLERYLEKLKAPIA